MLNVQNIHQQRFRIPLRCAYFGYYFHKVESIWFSFSGRENFTRKNGNDNVDILNRSRAILQMPCINIIVYNELWNSNFNHIRSMYINQFMRNVPNAPIMGLNLCFFFLHDYNASLSSNSQSAKINIVNGICVGVLKCFHAQVPQMWNISHIFWYKWKIFC